MTLLLAALQGPVPVALVAFTLNVYDVPVVKPVTVKGDEAPVAVKQPGVDVAVYPVIVAGYPVQVGAVNATSTDVADATDAVPIVGAPGGLGQMFCPRA